MGDRSEQSFSETEAEIMWATQRALREHGYADLTIQRIADEYGKTTAAIHYHYDTKEELLATYLDFLLEQFVDAIHDTETTDPRERLSLLLDRLLAAPEENRDLSIAMLEMRSQAPYKPAFRERFQQSDEYIRYVLKAVINHGIDEEAFADVDAAHATQTLMTLVDGARTRAIVLDDPSILETARRAADEYVEATLLPE